MSLFQCAPVSVLTAITGIRSFCKFWTGLGAVHRADKDTVRTVPAKSELWPGTAIAAARDTAGFSVFAVVEVPPKTAGFFENAVVSDFFGNGSTVFSKLSSDFFKAESVIQAPFNSVAAITGQMFLICHTISFSAGTGEGRSLL